MAIADPAGKLAVEPLGETGWTGISRFFRALGDPSRLALLEFLCEEEHNVTECVEHIGLSQGRVSAHLACLTSCGFVCVRREGRFAYYSVADQRAVELVRVARTMVADNLAGISGCEQVDLIGE
jgi:ArsR family transcriptional regulator, cadmium/lead-responsive transcriptional repressor